MRKRCLWSFLLASAVAALVEPGSAINAAAEPAHDGRTLGDWLRLLSPPPYRDEQPGAAAVAIQQMGSNAVPWLVRWATYDTPAWKIQLYEAINPILQRLSQRHRLGDVDKKRRAQAAIYALIALGPRATSAAGDLSKMLEGTNPTPAAVWAPMALASMGEAGLPWLLRALTNNALTPTMRCRVGNYIGGMGVNARSAVPFLKQASTHVNPSVRFRATAALRKIEPSAVATDDP